MPVVEKKIKDLVFPHALSERIGTPVRFKLIAATFSLSMLLYIDRAAISTARIPISSAFALSDERFGWILSVFALGYALFQAPAGTLADKFGPRIVLAGIVALWSVFTGATGLAWSFAAILVCRFLFGAAEAGAYPTCARAFYAWLPIGELGLAQGINLAGSRLGAAFALPVVAWFVSVEGWRRAFLALGLVGLVWAFGWYLWFRNTPEEHPSVSATELRVITERRTQTTQITAPNVSIGVLARSLNMWLVMGQYFASNFTFFFCLTWLFPYLQRTYHMEALRTGLLAGLPLVGGALGNLVGGTAMDAIYRAGRRRQSRQYPAIIGFVLAAAGILASLAFHSPLAKVSCLTVAVFGSDMTLPSSWAFCIDIGRASAGTVAGTMNMAGNVGSFVTSLAFPYLLAFTGSTTPFFISGAVLNLGAAFLWTRTRPEQSVRQSC
jgi:MFS transporter, ACS family, glucarate transporter